MPFILGNFMDTEFFDYIIIGAGPAGLSSAQYGARGGLKTLVLDASGSGGQVSNIPEIENYPGVFPSVNGFDLMETMKSQAENFGAKIISKGVLEIKKIEDRFLVCTKKKNFETKNICLATGAVHRNLNVPGEKELSGKGVSYCATCDGPFFTDKKIVVVGGGDSACSEATYLSKITSNIKIIHRRNFFRAQKAVVDKMLESGVEPVFDTVIKSINGKEKVESITLENIRTGKLYDMETDAVFIFAGMIPQNELLSEIKKDENGYIITNEKMETSVKGIYAAGDVRSKDFRQIVTAVSDGAIAAYSVINSQEI